MAICGSIKDWLFSSIHGISQQANEYAVVIHCLYSSLLSQLLMPVPPTLNGKKCRRLLELIQKVHGSLDDDSNFRLIQIDQPKAS